MLGKTLSRVEYEQPRKNENICPPGAERQSSRRAYVVLSRNNAAVQPGKRPKQLNEMNEIGLIDCERIDLTKPNRIHVKTFY